MTAASKRCREGSAYCQITNPAYVGDGNGQWKLVPFDLAAFQETVPIGASGVFFLIDVTDQPVYEYIIEKGAGRRQGVAPLHSRQGFLFGGMRPVRHQRS